MDTPLNKYHLLIDTTISKLIRCGNDLDQFNEFYNQLHDVVAQHGLTLNHINILLDEITDPESSFRISMKNKLINILIPRELIDFNTLMKIIAVFKVTSYYTKKDKKRMLPQTIQSKLAHFLTKNIVNIKWEPNCLCLGNILFDLLSIGFLRAGISSFIIYYLNIAKQIDPQYNLKFFFNIKKILSIIDFYEMDIKSMLPLLVFTNVYLSSIDKSTEFDSLHFKIKSFIRNAKFSKDTFGKVDSVYITSLLSMERDSMDLMMLEDNVKLIHRICTNLNTNFVNTGATLIRKRKYLEDDKSSSLSHLNNIYSGEEFANTIKFSKQHSNILDILNYFHAANTESFNNIKSSEINVNGIDVNFCAFNSAIYYSIEYNIDILNHQLLQMLNIKNNTLILTSNMQWIFVSLSNMSRFTGSLFPVVEKIISGSLKIEYSGRINDIYQILHISEHLKYLRPDSKRYQKFMNDLVTHIMLLNDVKCMRGLVEMIQSWRNALPHYNNVVELILNKFTIKNKAMIFEVLLVYQTLHSVPLEEIDTNILLRPDVICTCLLTRDISKMDLLLQHITFTDRYFGVYFKSSVSRTINHGYISDLTSILFNKETIQSGILKQLLLTKTQDTHLTLGSMMKCQDKSTDELIIQLKERSYFGILKFYELFVR